MILKIKQATRRGFIELHVPGVFDASYPNSKNRRGRVQAGGAISPAVCAMDNAVYYVAVVWKNE